MIDSAANPAFACALYAAAALLAAAAYFLIMAVISWRRQRPKGHFYE